MSKESPRYTEEFKKSVVKNVFTAASRVSGRVWSLARITAFAFAFVFVSLVYCIWQRGVKSRANLSPFWGTTYLENWIYRVVWGSPKRKISNAQKQTQKTGSKEWGHAHKAGRTFHS